MLLLKESKSRHLSEMDFHEEDNDVLKNRCHSQIFSKIVALKKFTIFTGKCLCWSLFLMKLLDFRPGTLFKRDSWTGVFLCAHCENFKYTFFYRTPLVAAFLLFYCFSQRKLSASNFLTWPFLLEETLLWLFRWRIFLFTISIVIF